MNTLFIVIDRRRLPEIKPLWEKLNRAHGEDSRYFKEHFASFTFEKRCEKFSRLADDALRIEIVRDGEVPVGYCIATMDRGAGEIDSLFVEEEYRKHGLGGRLVENGLQWMQDRGCRRIMAGVAEGHEAVFPFYQRFGFYPRMTCLQWKG